MKRLLLAVLVVAPVTLVAQERTLQPRPGGAPASVRPPAPQPPPQQQPRQTPLLKSQSGRLFPPSALGLLEAPDRDEWNKPDLIMDALGIADGSIVADLGAGSGWFTVRLARRVGPNGLVYGQDIQPEMIEVINRQAQLEGLKNVRTVRGTQTDPKIPGGLDAVLIMNAFHEMDDPAHPNVIVTFLQNVARTLKPQGRLGIADFLPGDGGPGPSAAERVDEQRVMRAAEAAGLSLQTREMVPPFQYLLVFTRAAAPSKRSS
ncbi:MAG: class I SAM-dependent methyltransferase [Acidobacteriaceae bacterium]|nr:class I SAM-dependent methyltransferase [Acidobacteriaceae bacterium]